MQSQQEKERTQKENCDKIELIANSSKLLTLEIGSQFVEMDNFLDYFLEMIGIDSDIQFTLLYMDQGQKKTFPTFNIKFQSLPEQYHTRLKQIILIESDSQEFFLPNKLINVKSRDEVKNYIGPNDPFRNKLLNSRGIPLAVEQMMLYFRRNNHFKTEGIFRKSGNCERQKILMEQILNDNYTQIDEYTPHEVACKQSEPLITTPKIFITGIPMKEILNDISAANLRLLYMLADFISEFVKFEDTTKMTFQNMAIVFTPCLIKLTQSPTMLTDIQVATAQLQKLLEQFKTIVPNFSYKTFLTPQEQY
ncbi:Rho-type gtpase-activating protein [Paramecium bursaria]